MKRAIALLLAVCTVLCLAACSKPAEDPTTITTTQPTKPIRVVESEHVRIDGIYADGAYVDPTGEAVKLVYVFMAIKASDTELEVSSKGIKLKIGDNTYTSAIYRNACRYMPKYYYSAQAQTLHMGEALRMVITVKVPEADLTDGKTIVVEHDTVPLGELYFVAKDVAVSPDVHAIAQKMDNAGWVAECQARAPVDAAREQQVDQLINGYYFDFYVPTGDDLRYYEVEFFGTNHFDLRTTTGLRTGTYAIRQNYIVLDYEDSDEVTEIRYDLNDGNIVLYCVNAFNYDE